MATVEISDVDSLDHAGDAWYLVGEDVRLQQPLSVRPVNRSHAAAKLNTVWHRHRARRSGGVTTRTATCRRGR
jgi:hypothetical protein